MARMCELNQQRRGTFLFFHSRKYEEATMRTKMIERAIDLSDEQREFVLSCETVHKACAGFRSRFPGQSIDPVVFGEVRRNVPELVGV